MGFRTLPVVASAARTATGNSDPFYLSDVGGEYLRVALVVSAASGTSPTLDVVVQDTLDGTNWFTVGTFTQATAATSQAINIVATDNGSPTVSNNAVVGRQLRIKWTVGGTSPSFTFRVDAVERVED